MENIQMTKQPEELKGQSDDPTAWAEFVAWYQDNDIALDRSLDDPNQMYWSAFLAGYNAGHNAGYEQRKKDAYKIWFENQELIQKMHEENKDAS
jgi:hypothetical protein